MLLPVYVVAVVAVRVLGLVGLEDGRRAKVDAADLGTIRNGILEIGSRNLENQFACVQPFVAAKMLNLII